MLMKPYIQNTFQNALCKCRLMWSKNKTFKLGVSNSKNPSHTVKILLWCPFSGICKEISGSTIPAQAKIIYFMTLLDKGMLGQHKFPIMNTEGIFVVKTFIGLQMLCMVVITDVQNFQNIDCIQETCEHFALHLLRFRCWLFASHHKQGR